MAVHRLLQLVIREQLPPPARAAWARAAVATVNAAFPGVIFESWAECARLLPHGLITVDHLAPEEAPAAAGRLHNQIGLYLKAIGDLAGAREHLERALAISEKDLGPNHPNVATHLNNLAGALQDQGDYAGARERLERVLAICLNRGDGHRALALLYVLADIDGHLGDPSGAAARLRRALMIHQREPPSYQEGICFFRLARLAVQLGRPEAGLPLLATCYVIDHQLDHSDAQEKDLPAVRNLATELGYDEARLEALLAEVEVAYRADRGQGLVAAAFPDADVDDQKAGDALPA